jgi:rhodanese-related sulfurtransferase
LLDTRTAEAFAALHARGAIQIGLLGPFASWAAILFEPGQELLLIVDDARCALEAHGRLARVGLGRVIGYAFANCALWRREGIQLASISVVRCTQVLGPSHSDRALQLVDVRSRAEWLQGHLPRAISMPLLDLATEARMLPPAGPSSRTGRWVLPHAHSLLRASSRNLVYCREGFRATTAASLLLRSNAESIDVLIDGVEGWSGLGLPLQMPDHSSGPLVRP